MGLEEAAKQRFVSAALKAHMLSIPQLQTIIEISSNITKYKLVTRRKEDSTHIADWIEEILDPQTGYKRAHTWTRGTSKAPSLTT